MPVSSRRRFGLCATLILSLGLVTWAGISEQGKAANKNEYFVGKVVPLADLLKNEKVRLDADASPHWLALVTDKGKVYPLVKDEGARMFFKDKQLLNRPMRLTGYLVGDTNFLKVIQVHSVKNGKLHDVYYWCGICVIKRFEPNDCECCGYPMEFREEPINP